MCGANNPMHGRSGNLQFVTLLLTSQSDLVKMLMPYIYSVIGHTRELHLMDLLFLMCNQ